MFSLSWIYSRKRTLCALSEVIVLMVNQGGRYLSLLIMEQIREKEKENWVQASLQSLSFIKYFFKKHYVISITRSIYGQGAVPVLSTLLIHSFDQAHMARAS